MTKHILPKNHRAIRWLLDNGCTLTPSTHIVYDLETGEPYFSYSVLNVTGELVDNLTIREFLYLLKDHQLRLKDYC